MIYGHSCMRDEFLSSGLGHGELSASDAVMKINCQICRFAYDTVFAQRSGQESLIYEYADVSPMLETYALPTGQGEFLVHQFTFGPRKRKPKWVKAKD